MSEWIQAVPAASLFLSVIVIQELEIGTLLAKRRDPAKGALLRAWLDDQVLPTFSERILTVDTAVTRRSAALHVPHPRPIRDALIAGTALTHGMTVVTRNVRGLPANRRAGIQSVEPLNYTDRPGPHP